MYIHTYICVYIYIHTRGYIHMHIYVYKSKGFQNNNHDDLWHFDVSRGIRWCFGGPSRFDATSMIPSLPKPWKVDTNKPHKKPQPLHWRSPEGPIYPLMKEHAPNDTGSANTFMLGVFRI